MAKSSWLLISILLLSLAGKPGFADERDILGVWRLVSFETEYQATGEKELSRGKNPAGYLIFTPEGRMVGMLTNEGRKAAKTDQERADLFNTMVAYGGAYRVEGDKWVTKVDLAWNPALLGSEQSRNFRLAGDRLQEITPWGPRPEKGMARGVLTWERVNKR